MPDTPAQTCREAAGVTRSLIAHLRDDMAHNPYWACDRPDATEDEIYADGVEGGLGGDAGTFAASWTPGVALAHAELLEAAAAADLDMVEQINSRDPDNDGKTRVMDHPLVTAALCVARAYLGEAADA